MIVLVILLVLALVIGVGAIIEGLFWLLLIGLALVVGAIWFGRSKFRRTA